MSRFKNVEKRTTTFFPVKKQDEKKIIPENKEKVKETDQ
jgi:hypothetical protein